MKYLRPIYHFLLALIAVWRYRFPSRQLYVIGITGTKGKTTTAELISAILEKAGHRTAISSTLRFKVGDQSQANLKKMTMPGRGFVHKILRQAIEAKCTHAVIEMTSEGAKQFRHKFIALDALIFTNLTPEHIESHGSYERYVEAKLKIAKALERSPKTNKILVVNTDSKEADKFLATRVVNKITYGKNKIEDWMRVLPGEFNAYNVLAAVTLARAMKIKEEIIRQAISECQSVRGRMEKVISEPFEVIVDYAHTTDSLRQVYQVFNPNPLATRNYKLIAVLGGTGGGRDKWKRPEMGKVATQYCDRIFLTNEDPYDEDPRQIVEQIAAVIPKDKYEIEMDRRLAIRKALTIAQPKDVVIITGKGTDPYIMGPRGSKIPWDDAEVAREEFHKIHA